MVAPISIQGIFLVLGPARAHWPEPLAALLDAGHVRMETFPSMHEISARLAECDATIHALLLDPQILMLRDLKAVTLIARYVRLPIVVLPLVQGASIHAKEATRYGVIPWDQAAPALATLNTAPEPMIERTSTARVQLSPALTDNRPLTIADNDAENSVTLDAPNRYDELDSNPLISPQEMAALLGVIE